VTSVISVVKYAGIAGAVLAAKLQDRHASFVLFHNPDDLFICVTFALHPPVLSMCQSLLQHGLSHGQNQRTRISLVIPTVHNTVAEHMALFQPAPGDTPANDGQRSLSRNNIRGHAVSVLVHPRPLE
jgi:hypothetical protein